MGEAAYDTLISPQEPDMHQQYLLESWFMQKSSTINREVGPLLQIVSSICHLVIVQLFICMVIAFIVALTALIIVSFPWLLWNFLIPELLTYKLTVASGFGPCH